MLMEIRYVKSEDKLEWNRFDRHLPEVVFEDKVRNKQGYVMQVDGKIVGGFIVDIPGYEQPMEMIMTKAV